MVRAGSGLMLKNIVSTVEMPMENATGTPTASRMVNEPASTRTSSHSITARPLDLFCLLQKSADPFGGLMQHPLSRT